MTQTAAFAGGCFWGVLTVFQHLGRFFERCAGYAGGDAATAKYLLDDRLRPHEDHAEAVQITYDPSQINTARCCQFTFPVCHDPPR
jgi:peptide-methionine (S)-S-oxide reductase